jgi:hypothetical protein
VQQDHSVLSQTQRNGYSLGASWTKTKESRIVCQSYLETSISAENGKTTRKLFSRNFYRCLGRWPTKLWSTKKKKKKKKKNNPRMLASSPSNKRVSHDSHPLLHC